MPFSGIGPHLLPSGSLMVFLELRWEPGYIFESQQGWPFKIRVSSAKSRLLPSYEG